MTTKRKANMALVPAEFNPAFIAQIELALTYKKAEQLKAIFQQFFAIPVLLRHCSKLPQLRFARQLYEKFVVQFLNDHPNQVVQPKVMSDYWKSHHVRDQLPAMLAGHQLYHFEEPNNDSSIHNFDANYYVIHRDYLVRIQQLLLQVDFRYMESKQRGDYLINHLPREVKDTYNDSFYDLRGDETQYGRTAYQFTRSVGNYEIINQLYPRFKYVERIERQEADPKTKIPESCCVVDTSLPNPLTDNCQWRHLFLWRSRLNNQIGAPYLAESYDFTTLTDEFIGNFKRNHANSDDPLFNCSKRGCSAIDEEEEHIEIAFEISHTDVESVLALPYLLFLRTHGKSNPNIFIEEEETTKVNSRQLQDREFHYHTDQVEFNVLDPYASEEIIKSKPNTWTGMFTALKTQKFDFIPYMLAYVSTFNEFSSTCRALYVEYNEALYNQRLQEYYAEGNFTCCPPNFGVYHVNAEKLLEDLARSDNTMSFSLLLVPTHFNTEVLQIERDYAESKPSAPTPVPLPDVDEKMPEIVYPIPSEFDQQMSLSASYLSPSAVLQDSYHYSPFHQMLHTPVKLVPQQQQHQQEEEKDNSPFDSRYAALLSIGGQAPPRVIPFGDFMKSDALAPSSPLRDTSQLATSNCVVDNSCSGVAFSTSKEETSSLPYLSHIIHFGANKLLILFDPRKESRKAKWFVFTYGSGLVDELNPNDPVFKTRLWKFNKFHTLVKLWPKIAAYWLKMNSDPNAMFIVETLQTSKVASSSTTQ